MLHHWLSPTDFNAWGLACGVLAAALDSSFSVCKLLITISINIILIDLLIIIMFFIYVFIFEVS